MSPPSGTGRGALLVLVSAASFGLMGVLTKLAYAEGLNSNTLLALRFSIAALGMWLIWAWQHRGGARAHLSLGMLLPLVAMGAVGYVGQSFSFFTAIEMISATATGLLLYTYPVLVTLLSWLFFREPLTPLKLLALFITLLGAVMVLGLLSQPMTLPGAGDSIDPARRTDIQVPADTLGTLNVEGVVWGMMAAIIYSAYIIAGTRFTAGINPIFSSAIIISSAALVYVAWGALAKNFVASVTPLGLFWSALIAVVCTVLAISTFFAGLSIVGPSRAAIISTVEPAVTVLGASVVLGERLALEQALGAGLIMAGVLALQLKKNDREQQVYESLDKESG